MDGRATEMKEAVFVSARSKRNYAEFKREVPADGTEVPCGVCGEVVIVSPVGMKRLDEAKRGGGIAMAMCTMCTVVAAVAEESVGVEISAEVAEVAKERPEAKLIVDYLLKRAAEK
jgi:hypothetical protein